MLDELSTVDHENNEAKAVPTYTPSAEQKDFGALQNIINEVLFIREVKQSELPNAVAQYVGQLTMSSAEAFEYTEPKLRKLGVHAYFAENEENGDHYITVIQGIFDPKPRPWWPNALLFALTVLSLLFVGSLIQAGIDDRSSIRMWDGWPYALSLVLILGAHELGHYFAARHHRVSVTLPYFIPMPFGIFGTLGAFIQLREPMRNRRMLFDIGVAGPLAGLFFAVPILLLGLATSDVHVTPDDEDVLREGNSIFYAASKLLVFGRFLPDDDKNEDVFINQVAQAGWTGLFVTALNLIPLGQLDGGHVIYTLFGRRVQKLFWPVIIIMATLAVWVNSAWYLWTFLLFFFGRYYARPLEDITPLDPKRRMIGYMALIIFFLIFIPNPLVLIPAE